MKENTRTEIRGSQPTKLQIGPKPKTVAARVKALENLARSPNPDVVDEIILALYDKSPTVRGVAAELLGDVNAKTAVPHLLRRLSDRDSEVRMLAAGSLGQLLTGESSPRQLMRLLADPNELVRIEAAESLGAIGDRRSLPALWRAIKDRSALVRSYVAGAIGGLGGSDDIAKLQRRLADERSDTARVGFYEALYSLGRHDVLDQFISLLHSRDYRVRIVTAKILSESILDNANAGQILNALEQALRVEQTVAGKGSLRSSLKTVKNRLQEVRRHAGGVITSV